MEPCTCGSPSVLLRCLHSDPVCPLLRTPQRPHVIHLRRRHPCDLPGAAPSGPLPPCACCLLFSRCPAHSAILASRPCTGPSCRLQCSHGSCFTSFKALLTCPLLESLLWWPQRPQSPRSSFLLTTALTVVSTLCTFLLQ